MAGDYWIEQRKANPPEWIWCPVANVKEEVLVGPEGEETVYHGLKQFRPGAKLYICPYPWCFGRQTRLRVIGKPRKSGRLIFIAVVARHLENFRVKKVYDKRVIGKMLEEFSWGGWSESEESRKSAQAMCDHFNKPRFWEERQTGIAVSTVTKCVRFLVARHSLRSGIPKTCYTIAAVKRDGRAVVYTGTRNTGTR